MGEEELGIELDSERVAKVMNIVCTYAKLSQKHLVTLLLVSPSIYRNLISHPCLRMALDLRETNRAGDRLVAALSLERYRNVKSINLEFAQNLEDKHFQILKTECADSLKNLESLNLNSCQKISDAGIDLITSLCPKLMSFSIYWNVRVTDTGIKSLVNNCRLITDLNLSGCTHITDESLSLIGSNYRGLELLNLTRCIRITDAGLQHILLNCCSLQSLNLYALSSLTDKAYKNMSHLAHLRFLDLCGAQNLSDDGLCCVANCKMLASLNLTWCVLVTDIGVMAIAESCSSLELLSLFGIVGVTDKSLESLSKSCSNSLTTLDVNGCVGIKKRSRVELLQMFPKLECFKVHS